MHDYYDISYLCFGGDFSASYIKQLEGNIKAYFPYENWNTFKLKNTSVKKYLIIEKFSL